MMATPDTLYRVGSVSKPFTALLLMMFVEMGLIDLDAPIQDYLPEFQPVNKSGKKITLRQMLSHRSGLVREGPVGNYFDDTQPSLADTVKSISKLELVFEPGSTTSYSNMALATVGYVLERTQKEAFAKLMQRKLLDPIGMNNSSFDGKRAVVVCRLDPEKLRAYNIKALEVKDVLKKSGVGPFTFDLGETTPGKMAAPFPSILFHSALSDPDKLGKIEVKKDLDIYLARPWHHRAGPHVPAAHGPGDHVDLPWPGVPGPRVGLRHGPGRQSVLFRQRSGEVPQVSLCRRAVAGRWRSRSHQTRNAGKDVDDPVPARRARKRASGWASSYPISTANA